MTSPKDDGQAHQISVTSRYLNTLVSFCEPHSFPLSTRHNAMYGFDDNACPDNDVHEQRHPASSEAGALSDQKATGSDTASSRWVLGKDVQACAIDAREIRERCRSY